MNSEEFRQLEGLVRRQFEEVGLPDLGQEELYLVRGEEDELLRPEARNLLVEMLKVFERHLATQDIQTYEESLQIIAQSVSGPSPERAVVQQIFDADLGTLTGPIEDLSDSPNLWTLRADLRRLINDLLETPQG